MVGAHADRSRKCASVCRVRLILSSILPCSHPVFFSYVNVTLTVGFIGAAFFLSLAGSTQTQPAGDNLHDILDTSRFLDIYHVVLGW